MQHNLKMPNKKWKMRSNPELNMITLVARILSPIGSIYVAANVANASTKKTALKILPRKRLFSMIISVVLTRNSIFYKLCSRCVKVTSWGRQSLSLTRDILWISSRTIIWVTTKLRTKHAFKSSDLTITWLSRDVAKILSATITLQIK
jgi:hypothetical protein